MTKITDCVYGVSVIPQGGSLGHLRLTGNQEHGSTLADVENRVAVSLAGRVAEREVLGQIWMGFGSDLREASVKLLRLITGQAAYGYRHLLCNYPANAAGQSEELGGGIAQCFEREMNRLDRRAAAVITGNRELFDEIVSRLEEQKTLSRDQLFAIKEETEKKLQSGNAA